MTGNIRHISDSKTNEDERKRRIKVEKQRLGLLIHVNSGLLCATTFFLFKRRSFFILNRKSGVRAELKVELLKSGDNGGGVKLDVDREREREMTIVRPMETQGHQRSRILGAKILITR